MPMMPMTTAAHKPQETLDQMIHRIFETDIMTREDATRILQNCTDSAFYDANFTYVNQAIAIKLGSM